MAYLYLLGSTRDGYNRRPKIQASEIRRIGCWTYWVHRTTFGFNVITWLNTFLSFKKRKYNFFFFRVEYVIENPIDVDKYGSHEVLMNSLINKVWTTMLRIYAVWY